MRSASAVSSSGAWPISGSSGPPGSFSFWPADSEELRPMPLAARSASMLVPVRWAMANRVSPRRTV
jgi:hypothetical protein